MTQNRLRKGDRVRFLNAVGGGIVKGIDSDGSIIVEDDSGFDFPITSSELIKIEQPGEKHKIESERPEINKADTFIREEMKPDLNILKKEEKESGMTTFIAFLQNKDRAGNKNFDLYFINDSDYQLHIQILLKTADNQWINICREDIFPDSKLFITNIKIDELNAYEHMLIQGFAFKSNQSFFKKSPIDSLKKISIQKFYNSGSFRENDYFDEPALLVQITKDDETNSEFSLNENDILKLKEMNGSNETKQRKNLNKKKDKENILEIDLHAHELLDNTTNLNATDILNYQLSYVERIMEESKREKGKKIVFIHGKGNGTLRKAILDLIQKKYKFAEYQDASFLQYGFGATLITIH